MKKCVLFLLLLFLGFPLLNAQKQETRAVLPLKNGSSILYGTDVVINNAPIEDQRKACLAVAFNGWLFAAYEFQDPDDHRLVIYKSTDDGATWYWLTELMFMPGVSLYAIDIVATGIIPADIKIFLATVHYYSVSGLYYAGVRKYNGQTGSYEGQAVDEDSPTMIYDIALASDYRFPAVGTAPYSIGVLYSKTIPARDSLIFLASGDAGNTFGFRQVVTTTLNYLNKVAVAYGRCFFYNNGRYFAAWEEKEMFGARLGHIFVAHSDPLFSSPFTPPYNLDIPAGFSENKCKNPTIACQFNSQDNSQGNFSAVVLFERDYNADVADMDIIGMYNREAATTDNWARLDVANTTIYDIQPDINFDPTFNNFLVTWCDSTNQKLPYVVQNQDLPTPSSWIVITNQYNDAGGLVAPWPKVEINPQYTQVAHVWVRDRANTNGMVMFDAEYSTVGIDPPLAPTELMVRVSPNPASHQTRLLFTQPHQALVTIEIHNLYGQTVQTVASRVYEPGVYEVVADLSMLPPGVYMYRFSSGKIHAEGKILVIR